MCAAQAEQHAAQASPPHTKNGFYISEISGSVKAIL